MRWRLVLVHLDVGMARRRAGRRAVRIRGGVASLVGVVVSSSMVRRVDKVAGLVVVSCSGGITVGVGVVGRGGLRLVLLFRLVVGRGHDPRRSCDGLLAPVEPSFVGGAHQQERNEKHADNQRQKDPSAPAVPAGVAATSPAVAGVAVILPSFER